MKNPFGSLVVAHELRRCSLNDLSWFFDVGSEAWWVRHATEGITLAYITHEMAHAVIFTPESLLANWIWRICRECSDFDDSPEPNLVLVDRK